MTPITLDCGNSKGLFNGSDAEWLKLAYDCGYQKARMTYSSSTVKVNPSLKVWSFWIFIFSLLMCPMIVQANDGDHKVEEVDGTAIIRELGNMTENEMVFDYFAAGGATIYSNVSGTTYVKQVDSHKQKRVFDNPITPTQRYRAYQIAQKGTWWSPWYPVSCCYYCDRGNDLTCTASLAYAFSYTWSVGSSFTVPFSVITSAFSFGLSQTEQVTSTFSCQWKGGTGPAQMWYQQQLVWADVQYQECTQTRFSTTCQARSEYNRVNAPIKNSYHPGCSQGFGNVDCDSGRGQKCVRY